MNRKINYTVWLCDSSLFGYNGATNDRLTISFSKRTEKDYGNLIINYKVKSNKDTDFIVELLTSNQKGVQRDIISSSQTVGYKHLLPVIYRIRVIEEVNRNGKWDTENYRQGMQPERIFMIEKEMPVRVFWDVEEDVEL